MGFKPATWSLYTGIRGRLGSLGITDKVSRLAKSQDNLQTVASRNLQIAVNTCLEKVVVKQSAVDALKKKTHSSMETG